MTTISRVCVRAKPSRHHPTFKEWETAKVCVFVVADGREETLARAIEVLRKTNWQVIQIHLCDKLVEENVREQGGEILDMYDAAVATGAAIHVLPENFAPGRSGIAPILPIRITEAFMDRVVLDVGGRRIETDEENKIADYLIDDWVFELKDLQEDGLLHPERQKKLANLFSTFAIPGQPVQIDPKELDERGLREFFDILSSPIQTQVKKASKQIRSTKALFPNESLKGGILYLNTGYGSFCRDEFGQCVERYVRKDTTQIEAVFCAATWAETDGFESHIYFQLYPEKPSICIVEKLQKAFESRFEEMMTQLVLGLPTSDVLATPLTPIVFSVNGIDYVWQPGIATFT